MAKILIVEDDANLAQELATLLSENGYTTTVVNSFENVAGQILSSRANLVLLDINIPNLSGERILREVRTKSQIPIIMLTSKNTEADEIISMTHGADDFIAKPFVPQILLLRIEAILNRTKNASSTIQHKGIALNPLKSALLYRNTEIILTKNEFAILAYLIKHPGQIVSRADIMDYLWDDDRFVDDNTLTVNINRLRRKLTAAGLPDLIQTRRAQGYILE